MELILSAAWLGLVVWLISRAFPATIRLQLLHRSHWLPGQADLDGITALRADMRLGTVAQTQQLVRIAARYGFESTAFQAASGSLRQFGENILMYLLVLASNPAAMRADVLRRDHALVYLSRAALERRYGGTRAR